MSEDESAACTGNGQFGKRGGFERENTKSNTNTNTSLDTNSKFNLIGK